MLHDAVLELTYEQVKNEQLSYLVEGIDKSSCTEFVFQRQAEDLVYFDDGNWRTHREMLELGLAAAQHEAIIDPRRSFLVDWATNDLDQYQKNLKLSPGEKRVWASPYPLEVEMAYGKDFMCQCGLNPDRRLGFIYLASCNEEYSVSLTTQSIDLSDKDALKSAIDIFDSNPNLGMENIVEEYDRVLAEKFGRRFYAGRNESNKNQNAWEELLDPANGDIVNYLMEGLERLARSNVPVNELNDRVERHIIGVWALYKKRLNRESLTHDPKPTSQFISIHKISLAVEVMNAYKESAIKGEILSGCGGSMRAKDASSVLEAIFGRGSPKTELLKCVHCPLCGRQGVDAKIVKKNGTKVITCLKCHRSKQYSA